VEPVAEITSTRSAPVAAAARLARRGLRAEQRRFLAEGPQAVREALARAGTVSALFITADAAARRPELPAAAAAAGCPVHRVSGRVMETLAQTMTPQGVVAVCSFVDVELDVLLGGSPPLVVLLAGARDPGNVGTLIRTADAAGSGGVLLTGDCVDVYNGKCVRASAGSLFHVPITLDLDLEAAVGTLREAGLRVLAADAGGRTDLDELDASGTLTTPTAWLFGNEARGLPRASAALADEVVRVPIHGRAESLNLAVAAAVCLYASARAQRRSGPAAT